MADKLVFIEFRNTGASHVEKLLSKIVGGQSSNQIKLPLDEAVAGGRVLFGSIRDPWSWYLALWTIGCAQQGELYQRLTNEKVWQRLQDKLVPQAEAEKPDDKAEGKPEQETGQKAGQQAGKKPGKAPKRIALPEKMSAERAKSFWYADDDNADAFREWLRVMCSPQTRRLVDLGFAQSPISKIAGLMTYRYFHLYVRGADRIPVTITTQDGLRAFETQNLAARHVIRQDSLTEDLVQALEHSGVALSDEQRKMIYDAKPTGKAARLEGIERFYDEPSIEMVARREKFIAERFGYQRPQL